MRDVAFISTFLSVFQLCKTHTSLDFPPSPELAGPSSTGTAIEFDRFDIFILSSSHQVRRLNGAAGTVLWGWSHPSPDSVFLTGLLRTQDGLYAVGLEKGIKDLSVHVISLDPETGEIKAQVTVPSSISKPEDIVVLKSGYIPNSPLASIGALAFLDNGSVKQVLLTPSLEKKYLSKPLANKYGPFSRILDLGVSERGYLTTILEDKKRLQGEGAAHVYRLEREGLGLEKAGELGASVRFFIIKPVKISDDLHRAQILRGLSTLLASIELMPYISPNYLILLPSVVHHTSSLFPQQLKGGE